MNNSVIEGLMVEDMTISDLDKTSSTPMDENSLKYTCHECNYVTTIKNEIDNHIRGKHTPLEDEEVRFVCTVCKHEFKEAENYDNHVKMHDSERKEQFQVFSELENRIYCYILEANIDMELYACNICGFKTEEKVHLYQHWDLEHGEKNETQTVEGNDVECLLRPMII